MSINFLAVLVAALIPIFLGFFWYHPKTMGTAWMNSAGLQEADLKAGNMLVIFVVSFILSLLLAFEMNFLTIHQLHVYSALLDSAQTINDPSSPLGAYYSDFMENYGMNYRSFKHGVLHGVLSAVFLVLPVLGINALFERKGWKYILINVGYWIFSMGIMGGIVCAWI